jgi:phage tail-like protein
VPRSRLSDVLQSHLFWAFDASNSGVPVFNPLFGFSRISAPEISAEVETFKDGTFLYNRTVVKGGSVSPVLFERAASMFDADFYDWIIFTLHGNKDFEEGGTLGKISSFLTSGGRVSPRRNLLIVQFSKINIAGSGDGVRDIALRVAGTASLAALTAGLAGSSVSGAAVAAGAVGGSVALGIGPFEFATRIPARAWLLHNCLPIRYKSGSDFDASNSSISLQELEVLPEQIEEFSLGIKP